MSWTFDELSSMGFFTRYSRTARVSVFVATARIDGRKGVDRLAVCFSSQRR